MAVFNVSFRSTFNTCRLNHTSHQPLCLSLSQNPLHPLETQQMCMDISEWVQSAESEGSRGHSGTAMCSEYLSNHPASWISKQAECWAAFNIPLPSKRKKPQRSSCIFFLMGPDRDENKHSQSRKQSRRINQYFGGSSVSSMHKISWVWSHTVRNACHQEYAHISLWVSLSVCKSTYSYIVYEKNTMLLCIVKRQVKLILWKYAFKTEALKEGVIGNRGRFNSKRQSQHLGLEAAVVLLLHAQDENKLPAKKQQLCNTKKVTKGCIQVMVPQVRTLCKWIFLSHKEDSLDTSLSLSCFCWPLEL